MKQKEVWYIVIYRRKHEVLSVLGLTCSPKFTTFFTNMASIGATYCSWSWIIWNLNIRRVASEFIEGRWCHVPKHWKLLQSLICWSGPTQSNPTSGFLHSLVLFLVPPSHDTEQLDHEDQVVQSLESSCVQKKTPHLDNLIDFKDDFAGMESRHFDGRTRLEAVKISRYCNVKILSTINRNARVSILLFAAMQTFSN